MRPINSEGCLMQTSGLSYSIDGLNILKNISFKISKGEFVGIIGPNGAGKTTLLKCINRLLPFTGEVIINGTPLSNMNEKGIAVEIAHMHQNTSILSPFPSLNIVLMGRYPHIKRFSGEGPEDYKIARSSMEYTETLKFQKTPVNKLSGGERQRVLFAKVLAQQTRLILLDEPTANLDITHQEQIFNFCKGLCSKGTAVITAVHDLKMAAKFCTRLLLMKDGLIIADGSPEEVLTSDNLYKAYGVKALVYRNKVTGELDIHVFTVKTSGKSKKVHVIGGGGSASGVMRQLIEYGYDITAGVFSEGDSDIQTAEVYGINHLTCKPFSDIPEDTHAQNLKNIMDSELTILCNMPFGHQNIRNLEAAGKASKLVLIEDDTPESRDFTGGAALKVYEAIRKNAVVTTSARLHEVM